jgi:inner membrane protein
MLFRTHIVFSVLVYLVLVRYFMIGSPIIFGIFLIIATMFVDIDSRKSKMGKGWWFRPIQWFVRHRGIFHSLLFGLLVSVIIAAIHAWAGVGFFVGYLSHLFMDCFTRSGVKVFWPVYDNKISFGWVRSGGVAEDVIFVLLLLLDLWLVWMWIVIV